MATHKDAIKRAKQSIARRNRNKSNRTRVRNGLKAARTAIESGDVVASVEAFREAVSTLQHVASKGVIHRNTAARKISRLNKAIKALSAE